MTAESNVIFYMRLIHELKAEHPNVPDEVVKETVIKFGGDKDLCTRELASHSKLLSRSKRKVEEGKFYAAQRALLTHQMEQYLKLDGELRLERSKLNTVREEIALMEERRNKKCLVKMNAQVKRNEGLEKDIKGLRYSCDTLAAKVTKITKGKIPLGETNIQFYQFLSPKLSDSNGKKPPVSMKDSKEPFNDLSTFINVLDKKAKSSSSSPGVVVQPSSNDQWACTECTFLNHPALNHCEECEMPRFALGSSENDALGTSQVFMGENNLLS